MNTLVRFYVPVFLWCALIFFLSSIPSLKLTESFLDFILRKAAHIFMYFVLFLLTYRALINAGPKNFSKAWLHPEIWVIGFPVQGFPFSLKARASFVVAFVFSALYALSDEIHQAFVPTRSGTFGDFLIDTIGIILAIISIKYHEKKT